MQKKTLLSPEVVCVQMLDFETSKFNSDVSKSNSWKNSQHFFLKNYVTSEGAISHNVLKNLHPLLANKYGFVLIIIFLVITNSVRCL